MASFVPMYMMWRKCNMQESETFENKLQRLEQIVRAMEKGDVPLDESLKLF